MDAPRSSVGRYPGRRTAGRRPSRAHDQAGSGPNGSHRIIYSVAVDKPVVGLTFDDGPDPEFTPRLLKVLADYEVTATFLMMGYNAAHHGDIAREVVAAGHEVGNPPSPPPRLLLPRCNRDRHSDPAGARGHRRTDPTKGPRSSARPGE